jgi:anti-anti-sigma factor
VTAPGIQFEVTASDAIGFRVRIAGEIDMATIGALDKALAEIADAVAPGRRLVVDVAHVTFLSASGVRVLVQTGERVRCAGGAFAIDPVSPVVERVLQACGFGDVVGVVPGEPASAPPTR